MSEKPKQKSRSINIIALVAGEGSGDQLGADLIDSLKLKYPNCQFIGIGGKKMIESGLDSLFPMEKISVMGIWEPLIRLRELLSLRKKLMVFLEKNKPDIFIGIDSPDFNLPVARFLKKKLLIKTVQYVSPSVWAWRKGRIKKIEKSIDLMLTLFPFEAEAYRGSNLKVKYVGHPLAHEFTHEFQHKENKEGFLTIGLLPGSRKSEVKLLAPLIIEAAIKLQKKYIKIKFVMPLLEEEHLNLFKFSKESIPSLEFVFMNSHEALRRCDYALIASGTASLEALLMSVPSVVIYKTSWINYKIIKPLLNIKYIALPNLLANKKLIPELLQNEVTIENILDSFDELVSQDKSVLLKEFKVIHKSLMAGGRLAARDEILKFYSEC